MAWNFGTKAKAREAASAPTAGGSIEERLSAALAAGTLTGRSGRPVEITQESVHPAGAKFLRALAERERVVRTIETGLGFGVSACVLAQAVSASGEPGARHTAIDPFQKQFDHAGVEMLRVTGAQEFVEHVEEDSTTALPRLVAEGKKYDLGFIDGDHHFEPTFCDAYYMMRLVKPGGWIVFDDAYLPAVRAVVDFFVGNWEVPSYRPRDIEGFESMGNDVHFRFIAVRAVERVPRRPGSHFVPFGAERAGVHPLRLSSGKSR